MNTHTCTVYCSNFGGLVSGLCSPRLRLLDKNTNSKQNTQDTKGTFRVHDNNVLKKIFLCVFGVHTTMLSKGFPFTQIREND